MSLSRLRSAILASGLAVLSTTACSKPEPPKIVPKEARVTAIGPEGVDVLVKVEATNPNRVTLSAQSVTAKAKLDGKYDLGEVSIAKPVVLPPNAPTAFEAPLRMKWTDLQALAALASAQRAVPYVVDGTVAVGGERFQIDVPFHVEGTITREQMVSAALRGLPALGGAGLPR